MPEMPDASARTRFQALAGVRASVLGFGKVGQSLAQWLRQVGAEVVCVSSRRKPDEAALSQLGAAFELPEHLRTEGQDVLLLAVPDASLGQLARELAERPQASVVLHASGSLGAQVLEPLRDVGSAIGALHPLRAFPGVSNQSDDAVGTFFALDGDALAMSWGRRIVSAWGGESAHVDATSRPLYHAAATLAAGGVTTLMAVADEIAGQLKLPSAAVRGYMALARGALAQVGEGSPVQAITGPAARGDNSTLKTHRQQLDRRMPHLLPLFDALTEATQQQMMRGPSEMFSATLPGPGNPASEATSKDRGRP